MHVLVSILQDDMIQRSTVKQRAKYATCQTRSCEKIGRRRMATEALIPQQRRDKREGGISAVFTSFSGKKAQPLPSRFRDLKRNLTVGFEEKLQKSWDDLVEVLKVRTEEVAHKRESVR